MAGRFGTRSVPPMTGDALREAFPNLTPSQRLALVERSIQIETASARRRARLARAWKYSPLAWLIILFAGLVCGAVGLWNYSTSRTMLHHLEERAAWHGPNRPAPASSDPAAVADTLAGAQRFFRALVGGPPPVLPPDGPQRAAAIAAHRDRYLAYQTVGAGLIALGTAVVIGSTAMIIARRE